MIDAHVHFYDPGRPEGIPHPKPETPLLYRRMLPGDFRRELGASGMTAVVMIECSPWVEDNQWALELAGAEPLIGAVVGHLRPDTPEFPGLLRRFQRNPLFRGVRVRPGVVSHAAARTALGRLTEFGLTLDVLAGEQEFDDIIKLAREFPQLPIVLNHLGLVSPGPPDNFPRWAAGLRRLAENPAVFCKVSAVTETASTWTGVPAPAEYAPLLDVAEATFGPGRLIFGSNWPPCLRAANFSATVEAVRNHLCLVGMRWCVKSWPGMPFVSMVESV